MDNMDKLSKEDIAKLERTISKASDLTARQEEILQKILSGEDAIGKMRISYLEEFFDLYSKQLDNIITRKTSKLSDAFLILEQKANDNFLKAENNQQQNAQKSNNSSNRPNDTMSNAKSMLENATSYDILTEKDKKPEPESRKDYIDKAIDFLKEFETEEARLAVIQNKNIETQIAEGELKDRILERQIDSYRRQEQLVEDIKNAELDLYAKRADEIGYQERLLTEQRLNQRKAAVEAERAATSFIDELNTQISYSTTDEANMNRLQEVEANDRLAAAKELKEQMAKWRAEEENKAKAANGGKLTEAALLKINKQFNEQFSNSDKLIDKLIEENAKKAEKEAKEAERREKEAKQREAKKEIEDSLDRLIGKGHTLKERKEALQNLTHNEDGEKNLKKAFYASVLAVSDLAKQLEAKVNEIAGHKGLVDTRLQGSSNEKYMGSYWDQLVRDMASVGAINPFFKQETFAANIEKLVDRGIAFDLKQRAFLMTIQDKIANTFDVADGSLLRLIRIQQEDSTAGRLGMESALNSFLNNMYETSEYLTDVAKSVRSSLEEMEALMQGAEAAEVEYQVQKWLGSLYSVGMSQEAINSISSTLGQLGAGQIEGLTGGGASNLLVMAANDAGLSIADILTDGLDSSDTNKLLQASVDYLAELAEASKDNQVVQQQLAQVFGVKASDLKAATNLATSIDSIYGSNMNYGQMLNQLFSMAGSMGSRTSMAEMMTNLWNNGQYTLAGSMASSPISYFIYNMAKVLDDAAGGIDLPFVNVMGFGVDLNTTVSDLMRVAAVGSGILGSLEPIISGLSNSFSGRAMLNSLGIRSGANLSITPRGSGAIAEMTSTNSSSSSGYVGNASGSDVKNATLQEAEDTKKQQMIEAKEETEANKVDAINESVIKIYEILDDVAYGSGCFKVQVEGYGLTKASGSNGSLNSGTSLSQALNSGNYSGSGGSGFGSGVSSSSSTGVGDNTTNLSTGLGTNIELGGWSTVT